MTSTTKMGDYTTLNWRSSFRLRHRVWQHRRYSISRQHETIPRIMKVSVFRGCDCTQMSRASLSLCKTNRLTLAETRLWPSEGPQRSAKDLESFTPVQGIDPFSKLISARSSGVFISRRSVGRAMPWSPQSRKTLYVRAATKWMRCLSVS